jgi:hypothetical protein
LVDAAGVWLLAIEKRRNVVDCPRWRDKTWWQRIERGRLIALFDWYRDRNVGASIGGAERPFDAGMNLRYCTCAARFVIGLPLRISTTSARAPTMTNTSAETSTTAPAVTMTSHARLDNWSADRLPALLTGLFHRQRRSLIESDQRHGEDHADGEKRHTTMGFIRYPWALPGFRIQ